MQLLAQPKAMERFFFVLHDILAGGFHQHGGGGFRTKKKQYIELKPALANVKGQLVYP